MGSKVPVPGILWVNSDVIKPEKLSKKDFNTWYCDEHIPDVVAKSGVKNAFRYEQVINSLCSQLRLGFLTVYGLPDIRFLETEEFRSLEGQRPGPSKERIFENAEFETRSYELVQTHETRGAKSGPAPLLLYAALSPSSEADLDAWYRGEHDELVAKCRGHRRTTRYKLATSSKLSAFERSFPSAPTWLALHEFNGLELPWKELTATYETKWAKEALPGILDVEFGCFILKKVFQKSKRSKM